MIKSLNTSSNPAPPATIHSTEVIANASNIINKIVNIIIVIPPRYYFHKRRCVYREYMSVCIQITFLSKQVSQRSFCKGFIFNAHINCRIVIVGYMPFMCSPDLLSNNDLKPGFRYITSVNHGSISPHHVDFESLS